GNRYDSVILAQGQIDLLEPLHQRIELEAAQHGAVGTIQSHDHAYAVVEQLAEEHRAAIVGHEAQSTGQPLLDPLGAVDALETFRQWLHPLLDLTRIHRSGGYSSAHRQTGGRGKREQRASEPSRRPDHELSDLEPPGKVRSPSVTKLRREPCLWARFRAREPPALALFAAWWSRQIVARPTSERQLRPLVTPKGPFPWSHPRYRARRPHLRFRFTTLRFLRRLRARCSLLPPCASPPPCDHDECPPRSARWPCRWGRTPTPFRD